MFSVLTYFTFSFCSYFGQYEMKMKYTLALLLLLLLLAADVIDGSALVLARLRAAARRNYGRNQQ